MIKAYLTAVPTLYEGEDIIVRYNIFQDGIQVRQEARYLEYEKPAVVGEVALLTLLEKLEKYKEQDITIFINDAPLYEIVNGSNATKNVEVIRMYQKVKRQLFKFKKLTFVNVTKNKDALAEWDKMTEA